MNPPHGGFHNQAAEIERMTKRDAEDAARLAQVSPIETEDGKAVIVSDPKPLPPVEEPIVEKPAEEIPVAPPTPEPATPEPPAV